MNHLPDTEQARSGRTHRDELFTQLDALRLSADRGDRRGLWSFPAGERVVLVVGQLENMTHQYASERDPNYTRALSHADLDALIELHGHVRAVNPASDVHWRRSDELDDIDHLSGHLVVLGGPGLNERLQQILLGTTLPIVQSEHPDVENGEVFYVEGHSEPVLPTFAGRGTPRLTRDVCLFARLTNPFNSARTLTWCSGIFSRGVLGSVRMFTDQRLRAGNESYLTERFADATQFAIMAGVSVDSGDTLSPDLRDPEARLYEWSDKDDLMQPRKAQSTGDSPEAHR